jgi:hypothetical protein
MTQEAAPKIAKPSMGFGLRFAGMLITTCPSGLQRGYSLGPRRREALWDGYEYFFVGQFN